MTNPADPDSRLLRSPGSEGPWQFLRGGLFCYYLTSLVVVVGLVIGQDISKVRNAEDGILGAFVGRDGGWYREILDKGYSYDPRAASNVAFFPAFPLLARGVSLLTGMSAKVALLLVAHLCFAGALVVMTAYLHQRVEGVSPVWALLAMGLWPTSFFFRVAYSESLFLLLSILTLYGMERNWNAVILALIIGLATATRAVGVVLLAPFVMHLWSSSKNWKECTLKGAAFLPLGCWGICGYMLFQWSAFGDPLAFAKAQEHWRLRLPTSPAEKAFALAILEPIWSIFDPNSVCYWRKLEPNTNPFFSLYVANPIFFVVSAVLVVLGSIKGWLTRNELILSVGLLLVPYLTRGHEMNMISMGRFAATVFPVYLVCGNILGRLPRLGAATWLAFSGLYLLVYSAHFALWARYFY